MESSSKTKNKLLLVVEVCRHGARGPLNKIHGDPNTEETWEGGLAMLTAKGWRQHVDLGACIRKKYIDELKFLSPVATPGEVYARSTVYPRTIRSAEAQIEGLYPPDNGVHPKDFPIRVLTAPKSEDILLLGLKDQSRYDLFWSEHPVPKELFIRYSEEVDEVARQLELKPFTDVTFLYGLGDAILCEKEDGRPLPPFVTPKIEAAAIDVRSQAFFHLYGDFEASRLGAAPFFFFLDKLLSAKTEPDVSAISVPKFVLLAAHDCSLLPILGFLEFQQPPRISPSVSAIFFELWEDECGSYSVEVLYEGRRVPIEGFSEGPVPLADFLAYIRGRQLGLDEEHAARLPKLLPEFPSLLELLQVDRTPNGKDRTLSMPNRKNMNLDQRRD